MSSKGGKQEVVVDRFYLGAGLPDLAKINSDLNDGSTYQTRDDVTITPWEVKVKEIAGTDLSTGIRAFARAETWTDLDGCLTADVTCSDSAALNPLSTDQLTDTGLVIANPVELVEKVRDTGGPDAKLLHADFGLAMVNGTQVSTISATVGKVEFRLVNDTLDVLTTVGDAIANATTIGSSRGLRTDLSQAASTLLLSDFVSTSAGGGNSLLTQEPGKLGFLVLQNAGTVLDDLDTGRDESVLPGGKEKPLGRSEEESYAALRLGIGTQSEPAPANRDGLSGFTGYAYGLAETAGSGAVSLAFEKAGLDFTAFDPDSNSFSARLTFANTSLGNSGIIDLGAESAYVADDNFGATSGSATSQYPLALISGGELANKATSPDAAALFAPTKQKAYKHTRWGFFFGDVAGADGNPRSHVHMGSFAAGHKLSASELAKLEMASDTAKDFTATYNGHVIGNVVDNNGARISSGSFSDSFDFKTRTGSLDVSFDGSDWQQVNSVMDIKTGTYTASGASVGNSRHADFSGDFLGDTHGQLRSDGKPAGIVGSFTVQNLGGENYRAAGTFVAE